MTPNTAPPESAISDAFDALRVMVDAFSAAEFGQSESKRQALKVARAVLALQPATSGAVPADSTCPKCSAPCKATVHMRGGEWGWGTSDLERTTYKYVAPAASTDAAQPTSMPCEDCNGTGEVGDEIPQGEFQPPERDRCDSCDGTGRWKIDAAQPAASSAPAVGGVDENKDYPFYELRFIMRVLSSKGEAHREDWETARGMAQAIFRKWHGDRIAALAAPAGAAGQDAARPAGECEWIHEDDDSGTWATGCGNLFQFTDGGPGANDFRHCCYCGGALALAAQGDGGTTA